MKDITVGLMPGSVIAYVPGQLVLFGDQLGRARAAVLLATLAPNLPPRCIVALVTDAYGKRRIRDHAVLAAVTMFAALTPIMQTISDRV